MKYSIALTAASAAMVNAGSYCGTKAVNEGGNWFCSLINHIQYTGLDLKGTYQAVTAMNDDGTCNFAEKAFSGALGAFSEEMSIHIRGPAKLLQVAVYNKSATKKRDTEGRIKRHGHQHMHQKKHEQQEEKRADIVTATIDGKVVQWENNWFGGAAATPAPAAVPAVAPAVAPAAAASAASSKTSSTKPSKGSSGTPGDYSRSAYYNAQQQVADGLVFLGAYGAGKDFDDFKRWGNSLSYLASSGLTGAASAEVLADTTIPSNKEFVIMSDQECGSNCGFVRAGSAAYRGFSGADKVMLFEFQMPYDGDRGFNGDMSALWLLNANIPRTQQYGKCSCWPNCPEVDIFEVLASGDSKCKSTVHATTSGGSSDYFQRPADKPVKVAVITQSDSSSLSIKVLDDSFNFSTSLTQAQVDDLVDDKKQSSLFSIFALGS